MEKPPYMESLGNGVKEESILAISESKKSKATKKDSENISPEDTLKLTQAMLNMLEEIEGIKIMTSTLNRENKKLAVIIIEGCSWDNVGNLILNVGNSIKNVGNLPESVGNVGKPE